MRKLLMIVPAATLPVLLAAALVACGDGSGDSRAGGQSTASTAARETARPTTTAHHETTAGPAAAETDTGTAPATTSAPPADAPPGPAVTEAPPRTLPEPPVDRTPLPEPGAEPRFVCPAGGMAAVETLQESVDAGHQPWRLSAQDVAAACTFGQPDSTVEAAGPETYRVTSTSTGEIVLVEVDQPLGPGTVWVVTRVTSVR
jgi:hypothetical protein